MKRLVVAAALLGVPCAGCELLGGVSDHIELIGLVQRVSLTPGVDALDPTGPTAVGTDWRRVVIEFTEPMSEATAASFTPGLHLVLEEGLALDPAMPPSFNVGGGLVAARTRLSITLLPMPEGEYTITLVSPASAPLIGESGFTILGTFRIRASVVEPDGKLPYIVRFRPQSSGALDQLTIDDFIDVAGERPQGDRIAPHANLRVEFSERIRTPAPIDITPKVLGFVVTSQGSVQTQVPPGIRFAPAIERVAWNDAVEGEVNRSVSVLSSETTEGMELDTPYRFVFPGRPALTSYQAYVRDRAGEPLGIRFTTAALRAISFDDVRTLTTSPIRLSTPAHRSLLATSAFAGGDVAVPIGGEIADRVASVRLSLERGGQTVPLGDPTRIVTPTTNRTDVEIDRFAGSMTVRAGDPDGDVTIVAEALGASGESLGHDRIVLTKDTAGPALSGGGTVELLADALVVPRFCVRTLSGDAIKAELLFQGTVLRTSEDPIGVASSGGSTSEIQFCFDAFAVPASAVAGVNTWEIRFTDAAGNVGTSSATLLLRPFLISASPNPASPDEEVTIRGYGLDTLGASDFLVLGSARIRLDHGTGYSIGSGLPILQGVVGTPARSDVDVVRIRVPRFAASDLLAFDLAGTRSTRLRLDICGQSIPPFASDVNSPNIAEDGSLYGEVGLTGILQPAPVNAVFTASLGVTPLRSRSRPFLASVPSETVPDVTSAGLPILVNVLPENSGIASRTYDPASGIWLPVTIAAGNAGEFAGAVSTAKGPTGDLEVAYQRLVSRTASTDTWGIYRARRMLTVDGNVEWTSLLLTTQKMPRAAPPPAAAISLAFGNAGQTAIVYSGPNDHDVSLDQTHSTLWALVGDESGVSKILLDGRIGAAGAVSATFDDNGTLWVAYSKDHAFAGNDFTVEFMRVSRSQAGALVATRLASPGAGLNPSIAVRSGYDAPSVLFREASLLLNEAPIITGKQVFATWSGTAWTRENVTGSVVRGIPYTRSSDPRNHNLRVPRSFLDFAPNGFPRAAFVNLPGAVHLSTRSPLAGWQTDLLEVSPEIGNTFSMALDEAGVARVTYHDRATRSFRFHPEEDNRALVKGGAAAPACASNRYRRVTIPFDLGPIYDAHSDFQMTTGTLRRLGAAPEGRFDFLVTAFERYRIALSSSNASQYFEARDPNAVDRFFVDEFGEFVANVERIDIRYGGAPAIVAHVAPRVFADPAMDPEFRFTVESAFDTDGIAACCSPEGADCDDSQTAVNGCFAGISLGLCENTAGDPGPCVIRKLGVELRQLRRALPLLPVGQELDTAGFKGTLTRSSLTLEPNDQERDIVSHPVGDPFSTGSLRFGIGVERFEFVIKNVRGIDDFPDTCEGFNLRLSPLGTTPAFLVAFGPLAAVLRDGDLRVGIPGIAVPQGQILVEEGSLHIDASAVPNLISDGVPCDVYVQLLIDLDFNRRVRTALRDPKGELKTALDDFAEGLSDGLVTQPLEELLRTAAPDLTFGDPANAILIQAHEGNLRAVYERELLLPPIGGL